MDEEQVADLLEEEWDIGTDTGFFSALRFGEFDPDGFERVISLINSLDWANKTLISRRLAGLLWFIPAFMQLNEWRVAQDDGDIEGLREAISRAEAILTELFGGP